MAKYSNASGSLYLNVYIDQGSQDMAANTSTVNWRMTVSRSGAYLTRNEDGDSTLSMDLNGGRVHTSNPRWRTSGEEFTMASGSTTIAHNSDGSMNLPFTATFNPNNGVHGTITVSGHLGLTSIPRSSSVSVGAGTIGSAVTINITRQSPSFKHTVRYAWGNKSGTIASNVDTSTTWTIPLDFAYDIPSTTSGTGTIYVDTYSGSTLTGTQSTTFTAAVPASIKPTFTSITLTDHNTAAQSLILGNTFVQIISNIKVTFNGGAGSYGSTITGYKAEIVGKNQTTNVNGGTLGIMNYNGTITVRASVSDSRGRWSDTRDVTVTVLEYFAPALSFSIARTGSTSSTLTVTRNAKVAPLTVGGAQKNTMTLSFKVARQGTTTYTADTGSAAGSWTSLSSLTNSQANLSGSYVANQSWIVIGTLADKFTQTEFAVNVATESVVFYYDRNGIGVNKVRERGAVDVRGDIYANDKQIQQYQLTSNIGGALSNTFAHVDDIKSPGIWQIPADKPGNPFGVYSILECFKLHASMECIQRVTTTSGFMAVREFAWNNVWRDWQFIAQSNAPVNKNSPHPNLINTGWISTGVTGVQYKRVGDVVSLRMAITTVANQAFDMGRIPVALLPIQNSGTMLHVTAWTVDATIGRNLQINSDGSMALLPHGRGDMFNAVVTWII